MGNFFTLWRKEWRGYFLSPFGWVVLAFVLCMQASALSATLKIFEDGPQRESVLFYLFHAPNFWFYYLFIFPLITMRLLAEEERSGTLEALLTAPVQTWQVLLAKFSAAFSFYCVLWLPIALYPWIFKLAQTYVEKSQGYNIPLALDYQWADSLGVFGILFLMGLLFTAIGCLASAFTRSQIVAGIVCIGLLVLHYFLGLVPLVWGEFQAASIFHHISSSEHLSSFARGIIDVRIITYYLSMTALVLLITHRVIDFRRWNA